MIYITLTYLFDGLWITTHYEILAIRKTLRGWTLATLPELSYSGKQTDDYVAVAR